MFRRKTSLAAIMLLLLVFRGAVAQSVKAPVEMPFEFLRNQIAVQVKIAGRGPFTMLLDTDTDPSAIDSATARELGLQTGSKAHSASGGGTDANVTYATRFPTVELGSITAKDMPAAAIDLTKLSARLGRPIQGVLGQSFFKDRIVQIDYANQKIRFYSESPYPGIMFAPNTVNRVAMQFKIDDGEVMIDAVFINGQKMRATLDTGSSGKFALTPEAVKTLGLEEEARDGDGEKSVGYNGEYQHKVGVLKSFRLGRLAVDTVQATFWLPNTGHDKKKFDMNIGNDFFQDFVMTFDFKNKIVVFERVD